MKFFLSLLLSLMVSYEAQAQIINFPDPNFKNALVNTKCVDTDGDGIGNIDADSNNDGEIDVNEAMNVISLIIRGLLISNLEGIENFKNLKGIDCKDTRLSSLDVRGLINLTSLDCKDTRLSSLDVRGLINLTSLNCSKNQLTSLDVQGLVNLTDLTCDNNQLTSLDVQGLKKMTNLYCNSNPLNSLNVLGLTNLTKLNCSNNKLTSLDVQELTNLTNLYCKGNQLTTLSVEGLVNLETLVCYENQLQSLNIQGLNNLTTLSCFTNKLTSINIQELPKLTILYCNSNQLTSINVQGLTNLTMLYCNYNQLSSLDLENLTNMKSLDCYGNNLTSLNVQGLTKLINLDCFDNQLAALNLEGLTNLASLDCHNNKLTTINCKGTKINSAFNFFNNPNLIYICSDEKNIAAIKSKAVLYGQNCEVNSYCTFTPGGKFYSIVGQNVYDSNSDDCDEFDFGLPHLKFNISNGIDSGTFLSNATGNFSIPVQEGTHTITPVLENSEFFEVSPTSLTVTFPGTSDTITQNFCITPKEPFRQVDITIIPLTPPARPGFDAQYKIIWENKGNLLETGTIHFTYDENIFDYVSADLSPDAINSGKLSWDYTDLLPFDKREIIVTLNLNSPMENPPVNAGDITYLYANILDNVFRLENVIVGSYDPNDKTCLQGQYFHPDSVGKYVDFLIRFENTGNFAAENVVIKDIIDDKVFDVSSLLITDASHEVYTRIAANKVEFIFENIQLPFEDETNDGYVAFKIKTKSTLKLGDEMKNLADIYFDYNFPIRTNETQTTIAIPSGTKDIQTEVTIHPNPVRDVLTLDSSNRWTKAEIFDISGRLIKVTGVDGFSVDVSGLESGTYILHLSDKDKRGRVKFLKI